MREKSFTDCAELIEACTSFEEIVKLMQPRAPLRTPNGPQHEPQPWDRAYGRNFINLIDGIGTIEFRRPPAVKTAPECSAWVDLGASFAQAAVHYGSITFFFFEHYQANVAGLKKFITAATVLNMNNAPLLESILANRAGSVVPRPTTRVDGQSIEEAKKAHEINDALRRKKEVQDSFQGVSSALPSTSEQ